MLPLLSFHTLAARRGDGLKPELLALLARHAESGIGLSAGIDAESTGTPSHDTHPTSDPPQEQSSWQATNTSSSRDR
ncbi:hypothetical protein AWB83_06276 [Caballeronia ptereochthonis]|uniref:Uncharacterized protein n=1 Tax=Caballeronia ptereochthonis TaxID=1777144 RepID=A0A158E195_9BURK|nr:hypothetical protein AWB83_06276 [Caballeronia ptereochthonis]